VRGTPTKFDEKEGLPSNEEGKESQRMLLLREKEGDSTKGVPSLRMGGEKSSQVKIPRQTHRVKENGEKGENLVIAEGTKSLGLD